MGDLLGGLLGGLVAALVGGRAHRAVAEEVVLGLSRDEIAISTTFDGDEILIFGAVRREEPVPEGPPQIRISSTT